MGGGAPAAYNLERFLAVNSYLPQVATGLMGGGASAAHDPGDISLSKLVFSSGRDWPHG